MKISIAELSVFLTYFVILNFRAQNASQSLCALEHENEAKASNLAEYCDTLSLNTTK